MSILAPQPPRDWLLLSTTFVGTLRGSVTYTAHEIDGDIPRFTTSIRLFGTGGQGFELPFN